MTLPVRRRRSMPGPVPGPIPAARNMHGVSPMRRLPHLWEADSQSSSTRRETANETPARSPSDGTRSASCRWRGFTPGDTNRDPRPVADCSYRQDMSWRGCPLPPAPEALPPASQMGATARCHHGMGLTHHPPSRPLTQLVGPSRPGCRSGSMPVTPWPRSPPGRGRRSVRCAWRCADSGWVEALPDPVRLVTGTLTGCATRCRVRKVGGGDCRRCRCLRDTVTRALRKAGVTAPHRPSQRIGASQNLRFGDRP